MQSKQNNSKSNTKRNITPFLRTTTTTLKPPVSNPFLILASLLLDMNTMSPKLLHCILDPVDGVSSLKTTRRCFHECTCLPHMFLYLLDVALKLDDGHGSLTEAIDFCDQCTIVNESQRIVECLRLRRVSVTVARIGAMGRAIERMTGRSVM
jgi:hypothetical protein